MGGFRTVFFLSEKGQVYICDVAFKEDSLEKANEYRSPGLLYGQDGIKIVSISITSDDDRAILISDSGQVYIYGQDSKMLLFESILVSRIECLRIKSVTANCDNSFFLTNYGQVYSCGNNGAVLGHGNVEVQRSPKVIKKLIGHNIEQILLVHQRVFLLDAAGEVYSCGCGVMGILSNLDECIQDFPIKIHMPDEMAIKSMAGTKYGVFFLSYHGCVYSFGDGKRGSLGHADEINQLSPKQIASLKLENIVQILAYLDAVADVASVFFLSDMGQVFVCGNNKCGQLGVGGIQYQPVPKLVDALKDVVIKRVVSNSHATLFHAKNKQAYFCGVDQNKVKQLTPEPVGLDVPPALRAKV